MTSIGPFQFKPLCETLETYFPLYFGKRANKLIHVAPASLSEEYRPSPNGVGLETLKSQEAWNLVEVKECLKKGCLYIRDTIF